jgi:riboflavin biosynthesis pyrimidine reductase
MKVNNDFPEVFEFDSSDSPSVQTWWQTLGEKWVRVNIVTDTLGNTVGVNGTSRDLTGGADREILTALREIADVVVIGGATLRAEPDAMPRKKPVVVVSQSANVPLDALKRARGNVTILHGRNAQVPSLAHGVELRQFTATSILKAIHALGHRRIVVEGGVTLAQLFASSGTVDEWCQTLSPRVGHRIPEMVAPEFAGTLSGVAHDADGFRYTRRVPNGAPRKSS